MNTFRVAISRVGHGYLAESSALSLVVGGSSVIEAVETARRVAAEVLQSLTARVPATIMARIDDHDTVAFVIRPFHKPFSITPQDVETLYLDSRGQVLPDRVFSRS